jgi:recombination protein RecT
MTQQTSVQQATANNTPAPLTKKVDVLKNMLNAPSVQEQFRNALRDNTGPFVASIIDLYNSDSSLQNCEPKAVIMEALKAAVLKLPINKSLGFAWIVPYNNNKKQADGSLKSIPTPTFQIGYKGYIQLAMRTGQYKTINADVVYEGELRTVDKLTGEIDFSGQRTSDTVIGYFAHIELNNGFRKTLFRSTEQITNHAKRFSKSFNSTSSPWKTDFDSMALKTVISNLLSHYGYLSIEMIGAVEADQDNITPQQKYADDITQNANVETVDFSVVDEQTGEIKQEPKQQPNNEIPTQPQF